jgi:hypothetical protein
MVADMEKKMRVEVSIETLASIHSIGIGVSKDDVAPVITQIALAREGDALRAMTTDRYMILSGLYQGVTFEDWEDGETILVDPKALKRAVDIKKAIKYSTLPVVIVKNHHGVISAVIDETSFVDLGGVTGSFPPVMKLMPTGEPSGAGSLNIRPDFIARLAKVLPPVAKPQRDRVWRFEFRTMEDRPGKPEPVYAQYSDADTYKLEALIQPALNQR